jgi:hypothetical protein
MPSPCEGKDHSKKFNYARGLMKEALGGVSQALQSIINLNLDY